MNDETLDKIFTPRDTSLSVGTCFGSAAPGTVTMLHLICKPGIDEMGVNYGYLTYCKLHPPDPTNMQMIELSFTTSPEKIRIIGSGLSPIFQGILSHSIAWVAEGVSINKIIFPK